MWASTEIYKTHLSRNTRPRLSCAKQVHVPMQDPSSTDGCRYRLTGSMTFRSPVATRITPRVPGFISLSWEPRTDRESLLSADPWLALPDWHPGLPTPASPWTRLKEQTLERWSDGNWCRKRKLKVLRNQHGHLKAKPFPHHRRRFPHSSCSLTLLHQLDGRWFNWHKNQLYMNSGDWWSHSKHQPKKPALKDASGFPLTVLWGRGLILFPSLVWRIN